MVDPRFNKEAGTDIVTSRARMGTDATVQQAVTTLRPAEKGRKEVKGIRSLKTLKLKMANEKNSVYCQLSRLGLVFAFISLFAGKFSKRIRGKACCHRCLRANSRDESAGKHVAVDIFLFSEDSMFFRIENQYYICSQVLLSGHHSNIDVVVSGGCEQHHQKSYWAADGPRR